MTELSDVLDPANPQPPTQRVVRPARPSNIILPENLRAQVTSVEATWLYLYERRTPNSMFTMLYNPAFQQRFKKEKEKRGGKKSGDYLTYVML